MCAQPNRVVSWVVLGSFCDYIIFDEKKFKFPETRGQKEISEQGKKVYTLT